MNEDKLEQGYVFFCVKMVYASGKKDSTAVYGPKTLITLLFLLIFTIMFGKYSPGESFSCLDGSLSYSAKLHLHHNHGSSEMIRRDQKEAALHRVNGSERQLILAHDLVSESSREALLREGMSATKHFLPTTQLLPQR